MARSTWRVPQLLPLSSGSVGEKATFVPQLRADLLKSKSPRNADVGQRLCVRR
jgi:hypothetical protein